MKTDLTVAGQVVTTRARGSPTSTEWSKSDQEVLMRDRSLIMRGVGYEMVGGGGGNRSHTERRKKITSKGCVGGGRKVLTYLEGGGGGANSFGSNFVGPPLPVIMTGPKKDTCILIFLF